MFAWIQGLDVKCRAVAAILALVATIATGAWALDNRYAKSEDLVAQAQTLQKSLTDFKAGQLQSDRRGLQREAFELENLKRSGGKLTKFEEQRLQAIKAEIAEIDQDILQLRKK